MSVLAFDTSTAHCTAACGSVSAGVVAATGHAEHLAELVKQVAPDISEVTAIVVGVGPGPYTGLRVGVVTAAMMGEALGVPAAGVCSLDGLGLRVGDGVVVTDARRREVFAARYEGGRRVEGPVVLPPGDVAGRWPGLRVLGPAVERYPDLGEFAVLDAADLLRVPADLEVKPVYLRAPDATPQ